jgi:histidinol-phosphate aminotransferase
MKLTAKPYILGIQPYKPGKSKTSSGKKVIKLSSNENALKASPKVVEAYKDFQQFYRYPDGGSTELRMAIAKNYHLDYEKIVCGAGSDEIIGFLTQAFAGIGDEILYSEYGFLMYPISAKRVGALPVMAQETNLKANIDNILAKITAKTRIIFIANPNNPTGSYITNDELESLISAVPKNIIIVLDLAYAEFVDAPDYPDAIELVNKYENVVMTRTFSKIYGLASLRLGWSYSSQFVADILNRARGPFNISGIAQYLGIIAVNDEEFLVKSRMHNDKWLKKVEDGLKEIGLKTYPTVANFILIDFLDIEKCQQVNEYLQENGVILREMTAYNLPNCLRMTIGTEEENLEVLELLSKFKK